MKIIYGDIQNQDYSICDIFPPEAYLMKNISPTHATLLKEQIESDSIISKSYHSPDVTLFSKMLEKTSKKEWMSWYINWD
ncbi:MAG: hypothetical protein GY827_01745 [Cytophagales bacterium]|nr:hypothetical protein [Cytophagales bacterium]